MIEFILLQSGATPAQAQAAFAGLKKRAEKDVRKQAQKFWVAGGSIFFVAAVLMAGWGLTMNRISAQLKEGLTDPASAANQSSTPLQLLNILPDFIKPAFLKSAAPQVEYSGPPSSRCPAGSSEAAGLFGGASDQWTPIYQAPGWQMMNLGTPSTIRVPQGMYAAFVNNKTGEFSTLNGPVTISNINFIGILCD